MTDAEYDRFKHWRINALTVIAFLMVLVILGVTVFRELTNEFAQGVLLVILGRMLGYVDSIYNFEFGTTRGSKAKDDVITNLSATSPFAPTKVTAAAVGAAAKGGKVAGALKVGDVKIEAKGDVTIEKEK